MPATVLDPLMSPLRKLAASLLAKALPLLLSAAATAQYNLTLGTGGSVQTGPNPTVYFDITVRAVPAEIPAVSVQLARPGVSTTLRVWFRSGTVVGTMGSTASWSLAGSTTTVSASSGPTVVFVGPSAYSSQTLGVAVEVVGNDIVTSPTAVPGTPAATHPVADVLHGWSAPTAFAGNVVPATFNGVVDLYTPFSWPVTQSYGQGCGGTPVTLASTLPRQGTTMTVTTSNIPPSASLGFLLVDAAYDPSGQQPVPGLGNCRLFTGTSSPVAFVPTGTSHTVFLAVPAGPAFRQEFFQAQSVLFAPGTTPAEIVASNGLSWFLEP